MRIVHVTPFYNPVIGGVEGVVKRIAEYVAFKGVEVYVLTYNRLRVGGAGSLPQEESINNVCVVRLKPNIIWSHGSYSAELFEALRKLRPSIVHVHVWRHPHVYQVATLKEKLGFKAILHTHAPFHKLNQLGVVTWLYHKAVDRFMRKILGKYDQVIALTPHEKDILSGKLNVEEEKITVIPNGVNDELFNSVQKVANGDLSVLYIGRIGKSKNVDLLVKAMRRVGNDAPIRLVLAGPDENAVTKLRGYARKYNVNLHYLGLVSEHEKYELYSKCSVFAHPAVYEPFGITLLEAQSFGKPCVITGDGGQRYVAPPGRTSLYVKPDPEDFGKALSLLLSDTALYRRLSINARKWAERHLWSKILPKYDRLYDQICA